MNFITTGGLFFTVPILLMGIANIFLFAWLLSRKAREKGFNKKHLDLIMFLGGFAVIYGIFGQVTGFYQAAGAIQQAGEISPSLMWGGIKISLIAPIMGFIVLFVSGIMWFILRPGKQLK